MFPGLAVLHVSSRPPSPEAEVKDHLGAAERRVFVADIATTPDIITRSMGRATCPDTGRRFPTWGLAGEMVFSPWTGRAAVQGDTGYFGPKRRDAEGKIAAFGGDPLKYALPPATAVLWLEKHGHPVPGPVTPEEVRAYLSIPGNLRQQYHFAASNWARFLPLVGDTMSAEWHEAFRAAVATYAESRRPSDGDREHAPMPSPLNLVGDPAEHLGGGGTENHKVMFRTTGLLYAQWFPEGALVSGHSRERAAEITGGVLKDFVRRLYVVGNGEYQSTTYFPHSIQPLLNVYDFSPDPGSRAMARAALDYYFAIYALKVFNGVHTGAKRRGWVEGDVLDEMDQMLWFWAGAQPSYTTAQVDPRSVKPSIHQLTTAYRPPEAVLALAAKRVALPFTAEIAYADYNMQRRGDHLETLYVSEHYALGSVQVDGVNNSAQQTIWSMNVRGSHGSLLFGGGQPRWTSPEGHSPYDQVVQREGALLLVSGPTAAVAGQPEPQPYRPGVLEGPRGYMRQAAFSGARTPVVPPAKQDEAGLRAFFEAAPASAAAWLWVPREAPVHKLGGGRWVVETPDVWVAVTTRGEGEPFWLDPVERGWLETATNLRGVNRLRHYRVLVVPGEFAAYAIEAVERSARPTLAALGAGVGASGRGALARDGDVFRYAPIAGGEIELGYRRDRLRPAAVVDDRPVDWSHWAEGGHVAGGPLTIKDGVLRLETDAGEYAVDYRGEEPRWGGGAGSGDPGATAGEEDGDAEKAFAERAAHVLERARAGLLGPGIWRADEGREFRVNRSANDIGKHWWPRVFAELAAADVDDVVITQRGGSALPARELIAGLVHHAPDDRPGVNPPNPAIGYLYFSPVGLGWVLHANPAALTDQERLTIFTQALRFDPSHSALNMFTGQGTENHMLMGRTGGYLIAQAVVARGPEDALSGHLFGEAEARLVQMKSYFLSVAHATYERGFGEWDSSIYYPYVIACWLAMHDHAADVEVREAARAVLDWTAATVALRSAWGVYSGAEQRSAAPVRPGQSNLDQLAWLWWGVGPERPVLERPDMSQLVYAALSRYRPPAATAALAAKRLPAANFGQHHFETKPSYLVHGADSVRQQTRVLTYQEEDYVLGAAIARPTGGWTGGDNQDLLWKLVARDDAAGVVVAHGGLARDPWRQVGQWRGVLIDVWHTPERAAALRAAAYAMMDDWQEKRRVSLRRAFPEDRSREVTVRPREVAVEGRRATLVFGDGRAVTLPEDGSPAVMEMGRVWLAVRAVGVGLKAIGAGGFGGYVLEVGGMSDYPTREAFVAAVEARDRAEPPVIEGGRVALRALTGERVEFGYEVDGTYVEPEYDWGFGADREGGYVIMAMPPFQFPDWPAGVGHGRVPTLRVDGVDVSSMFDEAVYRGPNVNLRDEVLTVTDGRSTYRVDWRGRETQR